ncbi:acyl-CoA thioesterase, partial [Xanthomonas citri pv. citri]|nr:acyl-CoA thioesterase [Xanthomonas citri pv. citri]
MTASRSVEVRIPLRWADMDAYGHVNNIAVVQLLEEARVAAFGVPANTGAGGGQAPPIDLLEGVAPGVRTFISEHTVKY